MFNFASSWASGEPAPPRAAETAAGTARPAHDCTPVRVSASKGLLYNTSLGPIASPMVGPFDFYDTSLRVLPLLARYPDFVDDRRPASSGPGGRSGGSTSPRARSTSGRPRT